MKNRILSIILTICMAASLVPLLPETALAAETCNCLIKCTNGNMNADCPVCSKAGATVSNCTGRERYVDIDGESIVNDEQLTAIMGWPASIRDNYYFSLDHYVRFDEALSSGLVVAQDADIVIDLKGQNLKWTDLVLDGVSDPTKAGWAFTGWKYADADVTAADQYRDLVSDDTTASITLVAQWNDVEAPVISGVENGKTYCSAQTVRVLDNDKVAGVTVNGNPVSLNANHQFTLSAAEGAQTIVATDKADNRSDEITVTVNNGHTDENADYRCDFCGAATGTWPDDDDDDSSEEVKTGSSSQNPAATPEQNVPVVKPENQKEQPDRNDGNSSPDANSGNSAGLGETEAAEFSPEIIEGAGQSTTAGTAIELIFRSNAAFADFIRVELDGQTLDERYYTVAEGSTVVTLKADYVATLSAGEHIIGVVSRGETATAVFTVIEPAASGDAARPENGSRSVWWLALLLFLGVCALAGAVVYIRQSKRQG